MMLLTLENLNRFLKCRTSKSLLEMFLHQKSHRKFRRCLSTTLFLKNKKVLGVDTPKIWIFHNPLKDLNSFQISEQAETTMKGMQEEEYYRSSPKRWQETSNTARSHSLGIQTNLSLNWVTLRVCPRLA